MHRFISLIGVILLTFAARGVPAEKSAPTGAAPQTPRAFAIADLYRIVAVSDPRPSPDGKRVAYVTSHTDLERHKSWSQVWLVNVDGGGRRQLTQVEAQNTAPRFSPKGDSLAFLSDRVGEESQLYLLALDGGEPRRLTDFPGGVANPEWSPAGRAIAVTALVYPECGADAACNRKTRDTWQKGPLKAHLADELLYRHWESWRDGRFGHILLVSVADGAVADLTPGAFDAPGFSPVDGRGFAFSPDSTELCFSSNHERKQAESTNSDLWTVGLRDGKPTGAPVRLTDNPAWDGSPEYSPDGSAIGLLAQRMPGYESDRPALALLDRKTRKVEVLTEDFDYQIKEFHFAASGIVFYAAEKGRTPLYRLDLSSRKVAQVMNQATLEAMFTVHGGKEALVAMNGVAAPTEIFRVDMTQGKAMALTDHNRSLREAVDLRPFEEQWIPAPGGRSIHTFVVKPHGFAPGKRYPAVIKVHGGPQGMYGDAFNEDFQVLAGLGYVVAYCNPTGSTGYGQAFTDTIARDWGGKVFEDVMALADFVEALPYVDRARMGAMGWSYGGYMMMWLEGHTERFKAIAAMMGVYDLPAMYGATEELWFPEHDLGGAPWQSQDYRRWSPHEFAAHFTTPALVITGEADFRVPYTQSLEFFTALQKRGVPSRLAVLTQAGHLPGVFDMVLYYALHADWFHRYLGGAPSPWPVEKLVRNQVFGREGKR